MGNSLLGRKGLSSAVMLGDRPPLKHLLKQTWPTELSLTYVCDISETFSFWPPTNLSVWKTEAAQTQAQTFGRHFAFAVLWAGALPDEQPQRARGCWPPDAPTMLAQPRFSKLKTKIESLNIVSVFHSDYILEYNNSLGILKYIVNFISFFLMCLREKLKLHI